MFLEAIIMDKHFVITIGREFGSGGREIGMALAKKLGVKCYDKELLAITAKESGLSEEILKSLDERPTNSFLYSLVMDTYAMGYSTSSYIDMPLNQKAFMAQYDTIKSLADQESCVIVGRCADYALKDRDDCYTVFIKASMDAKIKRVSRIYDLSEDKAKDLIVKNNKKRANYYNFYANRKWGDSRTYDLCLDSSVLGIEKTVELLASYIEIRQNNTDNKGI